MNHKAVFLGVTHGLCRSDDEVVGADVARHEPSQPARLPENGGHKKQRGDVKDGSISLIGKDGYHQEIDDYILRILGLNLLIWVGGIVLVVVIALVGVIFAVITLGIGLLVLLPLLCLLIPAGWLLTLVIETANVAVIVDHVDILEGLRRGWRAFRENLGTMIVMGLILFLVALGMKGETTAVLGVDLDWMVCRESCLVGRESLTAAPAGLGPADLSRARDIRSRFSARFPKPADDALRTAAAGSVARSPR